MKIGLDIGGSHIAIGVINKNYELILKEEKDIKISESENPNKTLQDNVIQLIYNIISKFDKDNIELIGLACPGNIENGKIIKAGNLNIENMDIVKILKNKFNTNIVLRNDAECAALAEKQIGSLKNFDDAIFLTLGTGIGGAVFMNGKMLISKRKRGFEIGHMVIDVNGEKCTCGRNGCFETLASMRKLKNDIKEKLKLNLETTGNEIRQLLEDKDTYILVEDIINTYIDNLAEGIENLISIFKPEIISIGGSFTHYKKLFLDKLICKLNNEEATFIKGDVPPIVMAELKNEAGIIGATIV